MLDQWRVNVVHNAIEIVFSDSVTGETFPVTLSERKANQFVGKINIAYAELLECMNTESMTKAISPQTRIAELQLEIDKLKKISH